MNVVGCSPKTAARFLAVALFLVLPFRAHAVLGDNASSVLADQARMKGTLHSVDTHTYVVHEITVPMGTTVREFVSPAGVVFGVAWNGPFAPDFQSLLGPYYEQAKQSASTETHARRGPINIQTPGLVFQQSGHARSFHGQAYIPQLMPAGVAASEIH